MCNRLQLENFLNHLILGKVRSMRKLWKGLISMEGVPAGFTWSPGRRFCQNTNVSSDYKISCWCRISPLWQNRIHTMAIKLIIIVASSYVRLQELPFQPPGTISQHSRLHCLLHYIALTSEIIHHFPNIHHFATSHCSVWIWHGLWLLDIALPIHVRPTHLTHLPDIPAGTSYLPTYLSQLPTWHAIGIGKFCNTCFISFCEQ